MADMAKAAFNKKTFHQQTGLKFEDETSKVLHFEHSFVWCRNVDTSGSRWEISQKFWNVVLEDENISWIDDVRNERGLQIVK
jgi:hypothetical protein